jgi:hypothetical protein
MMVLIIAEMGEFWLSLRVGGETGFFGVGGWRSSIVVKTRFLELSCGWRNRVFWSWWVAIEYCGKNPVSGVVAWVEKPGFSELVGGS